MDLHYDLYLSPVGPIAMAATEDGLCALVFLGDKDHAAVDEDTIERDLRAYLPRLSTAEAGSNKWRRSPQRLGPVRRWLDEYFAGKAPDPNDLDMPLDLEGTDFQLKVWKQLTKIPYARTVSYGDIAKRLKQPGAARAVGLANNRNPLPILIPCHRVVGADGKMVGYGGGLWRKKALLRLEEGDLFGEL